jgi:pyruvate/2-oxoglutarate dehydrogenase complex dihydrolipoamide acyltransferase (E2) component
MTVATNDLLAYDSNGIGVVTRLKIHANINAGYNQETKEITYYDAEHLGFAVDTDQGLLSPVIHNAGDLSLAGLARSPISPPAPGRET